MRLRRLSLLSAMVGLIALAAPTAAMATTASASAVSLPNGGSALYQGYLPYQACVGVGNCVITGVYNDANGNQQGFVDVETAGVWARGSEIALPAGAVSTPGGVMVYGVSCPSVGNCTAIGTYTTGTGSVEPFVTNETAGVWARARALTLPANAAAAQVATPHSVVCNATGTCTIAGTYTTRGTVAQYQSFVSSEVNGALGVATEVVLPKDANANPFVSLNQIGCWRSGTCEAVGTYTNVNGVTVPFALAEVAGVWTKAALLNLPTNANAYANATLSEIACLSAGSCVAVGTYTTASGAQVPYAISEVGGVWRNGVPITMPAGAATNPSAVLYGFKGVSCFNFAYCAFGGQYVDAAGHYQGFLVNRVAGVWKSATELALPSGALYAGHNGGVVALSCVRAGQCTAATAFVNAGGNYQTMLVAESGGVWAPGKVVTLPGGAPTVGVDGGIYALTCFATGSCEVSGSYLAGSAYQGFTYQS